MQVAILQSAGAAGIGAAGMAGLAAGGGAVGVAAGGATAAGLNKLAEMGQTPEKDAENDNANETLKDEDDKNNDNEAEGNKKE